MQLEFQNFSALSNGANDHPKEAVILSMLCKLAEPLLFLQVASQAAL
jgi:hypothetical protein